MISTLSLSFLYSFLMYSLRWWYAIPHMFQKRTRASSKSNLISWSIIKSTRKILEYNPHMKHIQFWWCRKMPVRFYSSEKKNAIVTLQYSLPICHCLKFQTKMPTSSSLLFSFRTPLTFYSSTMAGWQHNPSLPRSLTSRPCLSLTRSWRGTHGFDLHASARDRA